MFSSDFWYGFAIGLGLVLLVFVVTRLIARARAKKGGNS
jgi:hypothetical protein